MSSRERLLNILPFFALCLLTATVAWKLPIAQSLWLDETLTAWVIQNGFLETIERSVYYQVQSPFYFLLVKIISLILGVSEASLRLVSFVGLFFGALIVYAVARELLCREAALVSAAAFISFDGILRAALSARPYSLAIFLFVLSTYLLLRWFRSGRLTWLVLYVCFFTLCAFTHYLFIGSLLAHIFLYIFISNKNEKVTSLQFLACLFIISVIVLPCFFGTAYLYSQRMPLKVSLIPEWESLIDDLFIQTHLIYLILALILTRLFGKLSLVKEGVTLRKLLALLCWYVLPPVIYFLVSQHTDFSFYIERYFVWHLVAGALLIGCFVNLFEEKVRLIFVTFFCLFAFIRESDRGWAIEDWRTAGKLSNQAVQAKNMPVLLYSGLIELQNESFISNRTHWNYLSAPLAFYAPGVNAVPVPVSLNSEKWSSFVENELSHIIESEEFLLVYLTKFTNIQGKRTSVVELYKEYFNKLGFESLDEAIGQVGVVRFVKNVPQLHGFG